MNFQKKIDELKIKLPEAKPPVGSYVATKISGNLLIISGQISISDSGDLIKGKVGKELSTQDGYEAAKRCGLSIVAQAKVACDGDLSKIKSCVKLTGFVNSSDDFTEQPKVINGASDLIIIHTEWNDFKSINFRKYSKNKNLIIYDMRNIFSPNKIKKMGFKYFGIGR